MTTHRHRPPCRAIALLLAAVLLASLSLVGCTRDESDDADQNTQPVPEEMTWQPQLLAEAAPCLVGWRTSADGSAGELVVLNDGSERDAIWRTPLASGTAFLHVDGVDVDGSRMVGSLYTQVPGQEAQMQTLLFGTDGKVTEMARPDGFEGTADVAFVDGGVVALVYHATVDQFLTALGLVGSDGSWQSLVLEGEVPSHQFVESIVTSPGSDLVGLVLKLPGGEGDRDDDMFVLARLEERALVVVTPPYYDDSVVGAQPLWGADGIVFARMWTKQDGAFAPSVVRVEWDGSVWTEREVVASGLLQIGIESGQAVTSDSRGGYWLRSSGSDPHGVGSELRHLSAGSAIPEATGVDLSTVSWFAWVEP